MKLFGDSWGLNAARFVSTFTGLYPASACSEDPFFQAAK